MKRLNKVFSMGLAALLSVSLIAGCGTTQKAATSDSSGPIKIGGNLELTGGTAMFGQAAQNAINLAFDQQNAKGGVLGKQLTLVAADNKSDAGESTSAVTKLVTQDKVVAVIGSMTSSVTLAAVPVVTDNKIPMISPSGTNAKVTVDPATGQVRPWIFRACFIDPFQGQVAANFALNTLKAKTAAVIIDQKSDYSKGLADAFVTNFKKGNGQIVETEQYVAGSDKDFRSILTRIKAQNPDMVWLPGYYQEVGLIVKQARELGMNMPFMGGDGWDDPQLFNIGGNDALNNTYYVDHVATDDPGMATFVKDYKAKFNSEPNAMAALGYDAANLLIKAISDAKSTDPEKIRTALENMKGFQGVGGEITIDPKTHNPVKSAVIKENKNGKSVFLTRVAP
ncbi:amino acid/amide ABC transporter substrate-binding protein, HAAT family [Desulfosporosinus acidiphilus SJ4]|uniref:Amino acid/amide ABC transporter substrate-binding protein, HAAT family n=1 Tax=Desulfosporosinus acidiphilus (strain DSM 22704 / JCM 16185 / SJ4) TaxID=646529 RepID=I4DCL2_DESAJ|nr:ABC transporter substrate-binding protein [Desulfosporosinus acidiphilus]AFM43536.1 amino acid/amide ABC transporter substrate-binding protein, HAAT family [Desulfosporosinus acidiphilus SJ4]